MWVEQYDEAIRLYEQALSLPAAGTNYTPFEGGLNSEALSPAQITQNQYLRARLSLAYILIGQSTQAVPFLEQLASEEVASEPERLFVEALADNVNEPFDACLAAYSVFASHYPTALYGLVQETGFNNYPVYSPERIGCDATTATNYLLADTFSTTSTPVEQLEQRGLSVQQVIHDDLNSDGREEWLVWLDVPMPPFFFSPDGDNYRISQPLLDPYLQSEGVQTWRLPDDAGTALVYVSDYYFIDRAPWFFVYDSLGAGMGGGPEYCATPQRASRDFTQFWMWRMEGNELVSIFQHWLCQDNLEDLFRDGQASTILNGGIVVDSEYTPPRAETRIYIWNDEAQTYRLQTSLTSTAIPQPTPVPPSTPSTPQYYFIEDALAEGNYEAAIRLADERIAQPLADNQQAEYVAQARYYRAFALEQLGHLDDALVEYVMLYENAPSERWRILAAIHLETRS